MTRRLLERLPQRLRPQRFLSLGFDQPVGERVADGGYHLDLRVKATERQWPPPELGDLTTKLWVVICQWGLAAFEHFVHTGDELWLRASVGAASHVISSMTDGGPLDGGLAHSHGYPHTFHLDPPWLSAMAQGEAASLLVRVGGATGEQRYTNAAKRALEPMYVRSSEGGCGTAWEGGWFPEEYPTEPPSLVLNGGLYAIYGLHDVAKATGDGRTQKRFEDSAELIERTAQQWNLGWWSRYDLYPHPRPNVSSLAYHELHIAQLRVLHGLSGRPGLAAIADEFERQQSSRIAVFRATAAKIAFRLAVPRRPSRDARPQTGYR